MTIVDDKLIGDVWPQAQPGADPVLYGSVTLSPEGAFEARSLQTFTLTYRAGRFGLDDTGSIKIVHRYSNDWGRLQTEDPGDFNYVTAQASNGSRLQLVYENGGEQRPWYRSLTIVVKGDDRVTWDIITTGNFGGFDAWFEAGADAQLAIDSNHVSGSFAIAEIGLDEVNLDGGGLERKIRIFRLPVQNDCRELTRSVELRLKPVGDNPIWVRVTTEDGFNAWSSPIFIYREVKR